MNVFSASAPSWLARSINPDLLEGGLASRVVWVVSEKRKQLIAWPEEDDDVQNVYHTMEETSE